MRTSVPAALLALALLAGTARAADFDMVMKAWCTQAGDWRGDIDVTDANAKTQRIALLSHHDCDTDARLHTVRERFGNGESTVKVTYADAKANVFRTEYFSGGTQRGYQYGFISVEMTDPAHWKTVIMTPAGTETYDGRPALVRYVRIRNGDTVESLKEVQYTDAPGEFRQRSRIVQHRQ